MLRYILGCQKLSKIKQAFVLFESMDNYLPFSLRFCDVNVTSGF